MTLEETTQEPVNLDQVRQAVETRNVFTMKLVETSNTTAYNNLAKLISLNEYTDETGTIFRAKKLTHIEVGQLKKLEKEEDSIDQNKDWDKYIICMKAQAKLLIKDYTDAEFDTADWTVLENIIVAWRMKPRGFRPL